MGEVVPLLAFFSFFGHFNAFTAYTIDFRSMHPETCFWWWESFGVGLPSGQIFLFYPPKNIFFQWADYNAIIFHGSQQETSLVKMVAPLT